jgi:non-specific serine/threonine protein kinase
MLLAILSALRGDADLTLARHEEGLALTLPAGETWTRSWSLWAASLAHLIRGDDTTAAALLHECLRLEQSMGESLGIGTVLETTGWIAAIADPVRAATLLGAAQNEWDHIEASIATMPGLDVRHSDAMGKARALAGQEAFERAWVHGRSLDQDSAIAFCLGEEPQGRSMALATRGHGILTRRELQVAELVHGGLSNQAIADRLVISPRTAETHVEHILKKLGFTSRTQVAAWFGEETAGGDDG